MSRITFLLAILTFIASPAIAKESHYKLVAKKKIRNGHNFVYKCSNDNIFQVEQHYNLETKVEEVRFKVNDFSGEWFKEQIKGPAFRQEALKACAQSRTKHIAAN